MPSPEINMLIRLLNQAYNTKSWHGTNLMGSLRGRTMREIAWRPAKRRHNIWEEVVHCAYWKYVVMRELSGGKRGSFPLKGSNWFPRTDRPNARAWKQDLRLLEDMHSRLLLAVRQLSPSALRRRTKTGKSTYEDLIRGSAAHDLYHAGQIQLMKALMPRG